MGFIDCFFSLVFWLNRCILIRVCGHLELVYGAVLSLISGSPIFAFIIIFAAIFSGGFNEPVASSFNWYDMSFAPVVVTHWTIFSSCLRFRLLSLLDGLLCWFSEVFDGTHCDTRTCPDRIETSQNKCNAH